MLAKITLVDHDGCITEYGPFKNSEVAAKTLKQKGWGDERFSGVKGQWTHQPGAGDRTYATIKPYLLRVKILASDKFP